MKINNLIDRFRNLEHNWDGRHSLPIPSAVFNNCELLFNHLEDKYLSLIDHCYPSSYMSINFEFGKSFEGIYLSVNSNGFSYFVYTDNGIKSHTNCKTQNPIDIRSLKFYLQYILIKQNENLFAYM